ncbi:MAG TPA: polysaccharide biosynthesis/export family protein [Candidatus Didemnitutus sp.]|nr:polysaccharide biosynthesis/export family protein [Candidatus Didemnitutus sp.]
MNDFRIPFLPFGSKAAFRLGAALAVLALGLLTGCESDGGGSADLHADNQAPQAPDVQAIREGDVLKVTFPGAPNLDTTQTVRRDGRITLGIIGEIKVSGLTPPSLEKQLMDLYSKELVEKEVTVTVVSSTFTVYVTGAVLKPGKITTDHPLTLLEAVMEAGGLDNMKADPKAVKIIRLENGVQHTYKVNLKEILNAQSRDPIYLKPSDSVIVPERFSVFN